MSSLKLNRLIKTELEKREMESLKGGKDAPRNCSCSCMCINGSAYSTNDHANVNVTMSHAR